MSIGTPGVLVRIGSGAVTSHGLKPYRRWLVLSEANESVVHRFDSFSSILPREHSLTLRALRVATVSLPACLPARQ